ncbi:MAG: hypothetical protein APF77_01255 [Clostridia bacterium BRH_c25]|nr:MAG: hypothetical protein APF77_01255 [Clostridia bacterium BRH_c25]
MVVNLADSTENIKTYLVAGTKNCLLSGGMKAEQIETLKTNLSAKPAASGEDKTGETNNIYNASTYIVVKGDCLWSIARKQLEDGTRYIEIYKLNENTIKNPDMIMIGQKLVLSEK